MTISGNHTKLVVESPTSAFPACLCVVMSAGIQTRTEGRKGKGWRVSDNIPSCPRSLSPALKVPNSN